MTQSHYGREDADERSSATGRLETALGEQHRFAERYDAARGTSTEMTAYADLREAGEQVAARDAWVKWLDRAY
jgi:hypothetical protein